MQVKCAHPQCMCAVPGGQEYCSEWCEKHEREELPPCECGHPVCEQIHKRNVPRSGSDVQLP